MRQICLIVTKLARNSFEPYTVEFAYSELLYKYFSIVNSEQFPSSY